MNLKRWHILVTVVLAVTVGAWATARFPFIFPRTPFRAKYDQVRRGMTRDDVRRIMTDPRLGPCPQAIYLNDGGIEDCYVEMGVEAGGGVAHFNYAPDGKLERKRCSAHQSWEPAWLEAIRWQLRL